MRNVPAWMSLLSVLAFGAGAVMSQEPTTPPATSPEDLNPAVDTSAAAPAEPPSTAAPTPAAESAPTNAPAQPAAPRRAPAQRAMDRLNLDATQITGNRELPKVLYIVPWKRSDLGDLLGKPVNSLLDEVLTPVDRDVFKRENRYYRALDASAPESGVEAAAPASAPK